MSGPVGVALGSCAGCERVSLFASCRIACRRGVRFDAWRGRSVGWLLRSGMLRGRAPAGAVSVVEVRMSFSLYFEEFLVVERAGCCLRTGCLLLPLSAAIERRLM